MMENNPVTEARLVDKGAFQMIFTTLIHKLGDPEYENGVFSIAKISSLEFKFVYKSDGYEFISSLGDIDRVNMVKDIPELYKMIMMCYQSINKDGKVQ